MGLDLLGLSNEFRPNGFDQSKMGLDQGLLWVSTEDQNGEEIEENLRKNERD